MYNCSILAAVISIYFLCEKSIEIIDFIDFVEKVVTSIKSPFNWVGNKYKFIPQINDIVKDRTYDMIVDLFMGSGNVILNLDCTAQVRMGNDKQKLIPLLFERVVGEELLFESSEIDAILSANNRFSRKDSYYSFRDYWNKKYLGNKFDRQFILETALLLKMCSNSMVRFNKDGVFNQGFRGLGKDTEFFKQSMLNDVLRLLNELLEYFKAKTFRFTARDFKDYKDDNNRLLILDPPYVLGDTGVYNRNFTREDSDFLLNLMRTTSNDFIYFNYIKHGNFVYKELESLIDDSNFRVLEIGDNNVSAGQGGKIKKYVKEVMVTNICD